MSYDPNAGAEPATLTTAKIAQELQAIARQANWSPPNGNFNDLVKRANALVLELENR